MENKVVLNRLGPIGVNDLYYFTILKIEIIESLIFYFVSARLYPILGI